MISARPGVGVTFVPKLSSPQNVYGKTCSIIYQRGMVNGTPRGLAALTSTQFGRVPTVLEARCKQLVVFLVFARAVIRVQPRASSALQTETWTMYKTQEKRLSITEAGGSLRLRAFADARQPPRRGAQAGKRCNINGPRSQRV
jgi:hypothetical protein